MRPDLAMIIEAWSDPPHAVKAGILTMVEVALGNWGVVSYARRMGYGQGAMISHRPWTLMKTPRPEARCRQSAD